MQGKQYDILNNNGEKCKTFEVNGTMPKVWDWLSQANFIATVGEGKETVDIWEAKVNTIYIL